MTGIRRTLRSLIRNPVFTATVVITLACGIGASTLIFSIVDAALLRPLPYPAPDRLAMIWASNPERGWQATYMAPADYLELRSEDRALEGAAAYVTRSYSLVEAGEPERLEGLRTSANLFTVLGVSPELGRGFHDQDDAAGAPPVVALSHELWRRRFGGDPSIVGRTLNLGGTTHTVVGVMPPGFSFPDRTDVWVPLAMQPQEAEDRQNHYLTVIGRLQPGITVEQADGLLDRVASRLADRYPDTNRGWSVEVVPLRDQVVGKARPALLLLLASVLFLLLIPCANVASLLLVRSMARSREMALRSALGATRGRLALQTLRESLTLALAGGVVGVALAAVGVRFLQVLRPDAIPPLVEVGIDARVLLFALGISLLTGLSFGQAPLFQLSRRTLHEPLRESAATGMARPRSRHLRSGLVALQVALAAVLLTGAILTVRGLDDLLEIDPGFKPSHALAVRLELSPTAYPDLHRMVAYYAEVLARAAALPGVEAAGISTSLPLTGFYLGLGFEIEGRPNPLPEERLSAGYDSVSRDYFEAMGIPLLQGRLFDERDDREAPGVAVINHTMARRFWNDEDPVGEYLVLEEDGSGVNPHRIVGVVGDVRHAGLDAEVGPEIYTSFRQHPWPFMSLVVRHAGGAASLAPTLQKSVWDVDPDQVVAAPRSLEEVVSRSVAGPRFQMLVLSLFAAVALILVTSGIYGMASYAVVRRRWELAVRLALGARRGEIARRVAFEAVAIAGLGIAVGLGASLALGRIASTFVHGVGATDLSTLTPVLVLLLGIAVAASYLPARRVLRLEPMRVLRSE